MAVVLEFVATHVSPLVERARLREVASLVRETFASAAAHFDARLAPVPPHVVSLLTLALVTCCFALFDAASSAKRHLARVGVSSAFFGALRSLPGVEALVARRSSKLLRSLSASKAAGGAGPPRCLALQPAGQPAAAVLEQALALAAADASWTPGECTFSGTVYIPSTEHFVLLNKMYARFAHSNPLHADIFAACARMEREVVAMTASVLGGGPGGSPRVCGVMTSGGTESICTAIRATRDFFGKEQPEMVVAASAHAAVYKAASYFNIRLVKVPVDAAQRMDLAAVRRAVNKHTILVYCSAPGFPHGAVDDVPSLAAIALAAGCGCHVDACLGGFVLPFATAAGHPKLGSQRFDFSVPGVTSMSVDTHKYGLAQKGSSVLLYSSPELRRCQYTAVTDWSGGLYSACLRRIAAFLNKIEPRFQSNFFPSSWLTRFLPPSPRSLAGRGGLPPRRPHRADVGQPDARRPRRLRGVGADHPRRGAHARARRVLHPRPGGDWVRI